MERLLPRHLQIIYQINGIWIQKLLQRHLRHLCWHGQRGHYQHVDLCIFKRGAPMSHMPKIQLVDSWNWRNPQTNPPCVEWVSKIPEIHVQQSQCPNESSVVHSSPKHCELSRYGDGPIIAALSIVEEGDVKKIRMGHLAIIGANKINGVAAIHTEIIKKDWINHQGNIIVKSWASSDVYL